MNTQAVIAEHPNRCSARRHGAEFGQLLTLQPDGDSTHRANVHDAGFYSPTPYLLDHTGGVGNRRGVRHRVHTGEAAHRRRLRPRRDRLCVLAARFPKVGVQIHEAGDDRAAGCIEFELDALSRQSIATGLIRRRHRRDDTVIDDDVVWIEAVGSPAAKDDRTHQSPPA